MTASETLIGTVGLSVGSGLSISRSAPVGIVCAGIFSFRSSISASIANEYFSKLKLRHTKLRDWIGVNTLVYEMTSKQTIVDKQIDWKKALVLKKILLIVLITEKKL